MKKLEFAPKMRSSRDVCKHQCVHLHILNYFILIIIILIVIDLYLCLLLLYIYILYYIYPSQSNDTRNVVSHSISGAIGTWEKIV